MRLCSLGESLGGVETLISHPATMTHAGYTQPERDALGITNGMVRISVGCEDASDLVADLDQALEAVSAAVRRGRRTKPRRGRQCTTSRPAWPESSVREAPHLAIVLDRCARDLPHALAYATGDQGLTYGRLHEEVGRLAAVLAGAGLGAGDRAGLLLPDGLDFVRGFFAVQRLGAVPVALASGLPEESVRRHLVAVRARVVLHDGAALPLAPGLAPEVRRIDLAAARRGALPTTPPPHVESGPADPPHLQLTSGTTGEPRAAMLTHANVMAYLRASLEQCDMRPGDVLVGSVPLHHPQGLLRFVLGAPFYGCAAHLVALSVPTIRLWFETIARVRGSVTSAPDFAWRAAARLVDPQGLDLTCLRVATTGGEPVRMSTIEAFERRFAQPGLLRPGYGQAEATLAVTGVRPGEALRTDGDGLVSCGRALPGVEMRIVDPRGEPLARGRNRRDRAPRRRRSFRDTSTTKRGRGPSCATDGSTPAIRERRPREGTSSSSRACASSSSGAEPRWRPRRSKDRSTSFPECSVRRRSDCPNRTGVERVALVVEVEVPREPSARHAGASGLGGGTACGGVRARRPAAGGSRHACPSPPAAR